MVCGGRCEEKRINWHNSVDIAQMCVMLGSSTPTCAIQRTALGGLPMAALDFSASTRRALARKGIAIIGAQAAPAFDGDSTFSGRVYRLTDNGAHKLRTHAEVMGLAQ